jgi:hypothetical protein
VCRGAPLAVSFPWRSPLLRRGAQVIDGKYDSAFVVDIYQTGAVLRQQAVLMRALTRATRTAHRLISPSAQAAARAPT